MEVSVPELISHLESHLGKMDFGWSKLPDGDSCPFTIARFNGGPISGVETYSTIGLSDFSLASPASAKKIRYELFIMLRPHVRYTNVPSLLQQVAMESIQSGTSYVRGQVIGPRGELFEKSALTALYATTPAYHPESFATCLNKGHQVAFAWLVPITSAEANYIRQHGWDAFEDKLAAIDPDLLNFDRPAFLT